MPYEILSQGRLARYGNPKIEALNDIMARYVWNIALSEALYPTLSILEVALRNRMDSAFVTLLAEDWLTPTSAFWQPNNSQEQKMLAETLKFQKPKANRGHLIADLTLGFWIGLFKNEYKPSIWNRRKVFDTVFPHCPVKGLDRVSCVRPSLRTARILRNRISHHEAIFDMPQLDKTVQELQQVIGWLSVDATLLLASADRFQDVYKTSWTTYKSSSFNADLH
jgi:hypothetical protein